MYPQRSPKNDTEHPFVLFSACVSTVGPVVFSFRVASPETDTGKFRVVAGGEGCDNYAIDLSGEVVVPFTGAWDTFEELEM